MSRSLLLSGVLLLSLAANAADQAPRNVIVMIADGCNFNHVDLTSCYQYGAKGTQIYDRFPVKLACSTYSLNVPNGYDPMIADQHPDSLLTPYTDSAAAATALACGIKTWNGMLGMDGDSMRVENLSERAEALGKASGVVSTVPLSHATPAGYGAHNISRGNYAAIAREMFASELDVILGCGHPLFDANGQPLAEEELSEKSYRYVGGPQQWNQILAGDAFSDANADGTLDPWTFISSRTDFSKLARGYQLPTRLLGIPEVAQTLQEGRDAARVTGKEDDSMYAGSGGDPSQDAPFEAPLNANVPDLATMSLAGLNVLNQDEDGFFLMIEGGAIDWASHGNFAGRLIEEMVDYNRAVEAVVDWVDHNSSWKETLLILTADHECGGLSGQDKEGRWPAIACASQGEVAAHSWHTGSHSNHLVFVYARGQGSDQLRAMVRGEDPRHGPYIDNVDLPNLVFSLWPKP